MAFWPARYTPPPPPTPVIIAPPTLGAPAIITGPIIQPKTESDKAPLPAEKSIAESSFGARDAESQAIIDDAAVRSRHRETIRAIEKTFNITPLSEGVIQGATIPQLLKIVSVYVKTTKGEVEARTNILSKITNWAFEREDFKDEDYTADQKQAWADSWIANIDSKFTGNWAGNYYQSEVPKVEEVIAKEREEVANRPSKFWSTVATVGTIVGGGLAILATGGAAVGLIGTSLAGTLGAAGAGATVTGKLASGDLLGAATGATGVASSIGVSVPSPIQTGFSTATQISSQMKQTLAAFPAAPQVPNPLGFPIQKAISDVLTTTPIQAPFSPSLPSPPPSTPRAPSPTSQGPAPTQASAPIGNEGKLFLALVTGFLLLKG